MEEIQHILRFRHDPRPLCNQPVAALTERIDAPSRQRKYLFSLLQRQIRRNQGTASFRASTTSTRSESPLMIRFRIGKWDAVGGTPGPYSDNMPPCSRMRACSRMPDGGITGVNPTAHHGIRQSTAHPSRPYAPPDRSPAPCHSLPARRFLPESGRNTLPPVVHTAYSCAPR